MMLNMLSHIWRGTRFLQWVKQYMDDYIHDLICKESSKKQFCLNFRDKLWFLFKVTETLLTALDRSRTEDFNHLM